VKIFIIYFNIIYIFLVILFFLITIIAIILHFISIDCHFLMTINSAYIYFFLLNLPPIITHYFRYFCNMLVYSSLICLRIVIILFSFFFLYIFAICSPWKWSFHENNEIYLWTYRKLWAIFLSIINPSKRKIYFQSNHFCIDRKSRSMLMKENSQNICKRIIIRNREKSPLCTSLWRGNTVLTDSLIAFRSWTRCLISRLADRRF